ncbi:MAG: hypothetical protein K2W33_15015 [Burkholderiales bacterium]|nr:hypothetical protein [Burkholderiales bacterium]
MDDYQLDFEPDVDGKYCLDHADSFEAGESIGGRLAKLVEALRPFAADAFVLTLRQLDTGADERDSEFFGGPDEQAILAFRQQRAIAAALDVLRSVPGLDKQMAVVQKPLDSTAFGAIMGAAYDFRDAHLTGSKNLQQTAHAALEASVRDAFSSRTPMRQTKPAFDLVAGLATASEAGFEIKEDPDQVGKWYWWHAESATGSDISYDTKEEACKEALACEGLDRVTLMLHLEVNYKLNGHSPNTMQDKLAQMVQSAIGDGTLTGSTGAVVSDHKVRVDQVTDLDEDELSELMADRFENGAFNLEDLPRRLARYGLMPPGSFLSEMDERMQELEVGRYAEVEQTNERPAP